MRFRSRHRRRPAPAMRHQRQGRDEQRLEGSWSMTAQSFTTLQCRQEGPVLSIVLDNLPVNAMTQTMFKELEAAFRGPACAASVRAVLLMSRGRHFSAGGDIEELRAIGTEDDA